MNVLIVDDNVEITDMLSFCFKSQGVECKIVNTGKEGLETILNEDFNLVLLDLAIPEFSGHDIFTELKKQGLLKAKNIVLFTASSIPESDIQQMLLDGAKGIIRKPVSIDEILMTIKSFS